MGVNVQLSDRAGSYRNAVLIKDKDGVEHWMDKRIPVPGGEAAPFSAIPPCCVSGHSEAEVAEHRHPLFLTKAASLLVPGFGKIL